MSDKPADKKPDAAPASGGDKKDSGKSAPASGGHGDAKSGGGIGAMMTKTPVMLGGVMIIEAIVLFAGMKFLGGAPKAAVGAEIVAPADGEQGGGQGGAGEHGATGAAANKRSVEIELLSFRAPNKLTGR